MGQSGEPLGVMNITQAQKIADEEELDLVLIAPTANPPVVKICDYAKFRFESIKKEKDLKKTQKVVKLKEVQLSIGIQENEIAFKLKNARKFIEEGNKVKVCMRIKGRQKTFADRGIVAMNN
ncbi:MAG: translation initiation factor IF-3, partial [Firmicutes bacterium]|nr:translation initiation factor IF-3 [Bacillota bacterium]